MNLIDFDLQKWRTGEYDAFTAEGNKVKQLTYFDGVSGEWFVGNFRGEIDEWHIDGKYYFIENEEFKFNLKLRPKVKTNYYNVYMSPTGNHFVCNYPFESHQEARKSATTTNSHLEYLKTIAVTNEPE